jgi:hypothetical protein
MASLVSAESFFLCLDSVTTSSEAGNKNDIGFISNVLLPSFTSEAHCSVISKNLIEYTTLEKESMTINLMSSLCLDVAKLISVNVNVYLCIHSCAHIYFFYNDNIVVIVVSINTEWV